MGTMCVQDPLSHLKGFKWGYLFFGRKRRTYSANNSWNSEKNNQNCTLTRTSLQEGVRKAKSYLMSSFTAWDSRCFSIRSISISAKPSSKIDVFQLPSSSSFSLISARVKQSSFSSSESIEENITLQMNIQYGCKPKKNPMLVWLKIIIGYSSQYHVCIY